MSDMKILRQGDLAILEESGDTVCFHVKSPDPVFVPARMRPLLDAFIAASASGHCEGGQKAFDTFVRAHGILPEGMQSEQLSGEVRGCACAGQEHRRTGASIYLLLSHGCNQACIYCLNGRETYGVADCTMMTEETARKALQQVATSIAPEGELEVVFFGGEPLLNWPLAKTLMAWVDGEMRKDFPILKIRFHLTTNLTLFPEDLIDYAKRHSLSFLVDVDGPPEIHHVTRPYKGGGASLADTMRHIEFLRAADIPVALRATVTSYNVERLLEVSCFHRDCGGTSSAFAPLNAVDSDGTIMPRTLCPDPRTYAAGLKEVYRSGIWPIDQLFPFNEYAKRFQPGHRMNHGCGAPYGNTPVVTADGKIFTCIYMVNNSHFEAGSIDAGDYPREEVLEWMREVTDTNRRECRNCVFQYLCGGGCPVGLFGIQRKPDSAAWAKRYTREISCAVSRTVLGELLFDRGRATTAVLERQLRPGGALPELTCIEHPNAVAAPMISQEAIWQRIEQEAIRGTTKN